MEGSADYENLSAWADKQIRQRDKRIKELEEEIKILKEAQQPDADVGIGRGVFADD